MSSVAAILGLAAQNLANGRPADALRLLDLSLGDHGKERGLHALRAQSLYALGDQAAAAGAMAALVVLHPAEAESLMALGLFLDAIRADGSAEAAFIRARLARPSFTRPLLAQALIRVRANDLTRAFALIGQAGPGLDSPERRSLETRLLDGLREALGLYGLEIARLASSSDLHASPIALQILIEHLIDSGAFEAVGGYFDRLTALRPDWPNLLDMRAKLAFRQGNWAQVVDQLGRSAPGQAIDVSRGLILALSEARLGRSAEARVRLTELAETVGIDDTGYRVARLFLAREAWVQGDTSLSARIVSEIDAGPTGANGFGQAVERMAGFCHPAYEALRAKHVTHRAITSLQALKGHGAFPHYPESYLLPDEIDDLTRAGAGLWIVKGADRGAHDLEIIDGRDGPVQWPHHGHRHLVQRMVARPLLAARAKATIALFVILAAPDPAKALIFDDGLVYRAPEPFVGETDGSDPNIAPVDSALFARQITQPARQLTHPGLDLTAADGEGWASIWSLRAYLDEIGRHKGVRVAGLAWGNLVRLARDCVRLCDHADILASHRAATALWSYPVKALRIDCLLDEDFKAHFLDLGSPVPATATGAAGDAVVRRLVKALARLNAEPDGPMPPEFSALSPQLPDEAG